jgi:hypothetical protein
MLDKEDVSGGLRFGGVWNFEIVRDGKVIDSFEEKNLVVDEGINHALNVELDALTQITQWYIAPYEANYSPVPSVTAATIVAAAVECTAYDEATRQLFNCAAATSKVITNIANKATFTINATKTIYGMFLASNPVKSSGTGTLFAAVKFSAARALQDDDQLLVTYSLTGAST